MAFSYNEILKIPERCLLHKRLTKAFFLKNFALSAAEKKLLNNQIQGMEWLASIKTTTANIPSIKTAAYVYEEIQIMICTLAQNELPTLGDKCISLLQKYIPYQMLVIVEEDQNFIINGCDKRINRKDSSKRTIEYYLSTPEMSKLYKNKITTTFFEALDFSQLDKTNLEKTYQSYIQAIVQYRAAQVTGAFQQRNRDRSEQDMANLLEIEQIEKEIISLAQQITKEPQLKDKVNLNIRLQSKRQTLKKLQDNLNSE